MLDRGRWIALDEFALAWYRVLQTAEHGELACGKRRSCAGSNLPSMPGFSELSGCPRLTHSAGRIAMSFRLFIYYCALCGGGGAFLGWMLGRPVNLSSSVLSQG